jgi:hypothetical protein
MSLNAEKSRLKAGWEQVCEKNRCHPDNSGG